VSALCVQVPGGHARPTLQFRDQLLIDMPSAKSISRRERTIVVGDLHGCYDELVALLSDIRLGPNDRVVAVGDLVVKGPKNREILDLFIFDPRFSTVIGNQDMGLLRCWRGENPKWQAGIPGP
jgi:hypothetical protein